MSNQTSRWFLNYLLIVLLVLAGGLAFFAMLGPAGDAWIAGEASPVTSDWLWFGLGMGLLAGLAIILAVAKSETES